MLLLLLITLAKGVVGTGGSELEAVAVATGGVLTALLVGTMGTRAKLPSGRGTRYGCKTL